MCIKHRADSGFRKFSVLNKLGFGRTIKSFEMPYVSYPNRWQQAKMNTTQTIKHIAIIAFLLSSFSSKARWRTIDIEGELKSAKFVGEIVFLGYDTAQVPCYNPVFWAPDYKIQQDTNKVWDLQSISYLDLKSQEEKKAITIKNLAMHIPYYTKEDVLRENYFHIGFWPKVGDTCLLILDSLNRVSFFGEILKEEYCFWDPYDNIDHNTHFYFYPPFKRSNVEGFHKRMEKNYDTFFDKIKKENQSFGIYYCQIRKDDFEEWTKKNREIKKPAANNR
jgi:hypothetical protein